MDDDSKAMGTAYAGFAACWAACWVAVARTVPDGPWWADGATALLIALPASLAAAFAGGLAWNVVLGIADAVSAWRSEAALGLPRPIQPLRAPSMRRSPPA